MHNERYCYFDWRYACLFFILVSFFAGCAGSQNTQIASSNYFDTSDLKVEVVGIDSRGRVKTVAHFDPSDSYVVSARVVRVSYQPSSSESLSGRALYQFVVLDSPVFSEFSKGEEFFLRDSAPGIFSWIESGQTVNVFFSKETKLMLDVRL